MILFLTLLTIYFIFWGAISGRLDGGGLVADVKEWLERILVMFAFVLACAPFAGFYAFFSLIGVAGIATGHGQYFLSLAVKAIEPEFFDFVVRLFFNQDPRTAKKFTVWRNEKWLIAPQSIKDEVLKDMNAYGLKKLYWRCVFGMFVTGSIVGLPAFILAIYFEKSYGTLFLLTGVVKSLSYMTAWKFFKNTEAAEYMNGGGRNALCSIVIVFFLLAIIKAAGGY